MRTLTLKAPAKVNLYLNVLGKRHDGFHNIETVFEKIDLCDKITLRKRKRGIKILCQHKDLPQDKRNLAYQAAEKWFAKTGCNKGVEIRITKKIPVAAGLGGGSSDAASVLLGLNRFFSRSLRRVELLQIAEKLGADISFFIKPYLRAFGRGKGELLTPLRLKRKNWYILVIPPLKISTRLMYQTPRIALTKSPQSAKIMLCALEKNNLSSLSKYSYNSFEPILIKKYKQILEIKKALKSSGAGTTLMSGSGPCVFGVTKTRKEAMDIGDRLKARKRNWQIIVTKTYSKRKYEKHSILR